MAAFGELLFYISTPNEQNRNNPAEPPLKDGRPASTWQVSHLLVHSRLLDYLQRLVLDLQGRFFRASGR